VRNGKRLFKLNPFQKSGSNAAFSLLKIFPQNETDTNQSPHHKRRVIKLACDNNPDKIANVDVALPLSWINQNPTIHHFWYVMDYNRNPIFGEIKSLHQLAEENGIQLTFKNPTP